MQSFSKPLGQLGIQAGLFVRKKDERLLLVRASSELRSSALKVLRAQEFHGDNLAPWILVDDPAGRKQGWIDRLARLRGEHARRAEAMAAEGVELGAWVDMSWEGGDWAAFGTGLRAYLDSLPAPMSGLVILLGSEGSEHLELLLTHPELVEVRWVLLCGEEAEEAPLLSRFNPIRVRSTACRLDEAAAARDLSALSRSLDAEGTTVPGGAGPRGVRPPVRPNAPPAPPPDPKVEVHRAVMAAALALRLERHTEAIRWQRRARDLCLELGDPSLLVLQQMALASMLLGAGHEEAARSAYEAAAGWARESKLVGLEAQARLALGMLLVRSEEEVEAAGQYGHASRCAEAAGNEPLATEALRLAHRITGQSAEGG